MSQLFPKISKPYVIMAPAYTEKSGGAKVLHLLCHMLNTIGQKAYINSYDGSGLTNPFLNTPLWDAKVRDGYNSVGIAPIAVYPDVIKGNPLGATHVVRWLLFYAGAYGGDATFPTTDSVWGFSEDIAEKAGTKNVLFLPALDPQVFYPPPEGTVRSGKYYYAHKHKGSYGREVEDFVKAEATEITNAWPSTQFALADLLRTAELLYVYEETGTTMAALLCGCPVVARHDDKFRQHFTAGIMGGFGTTDCLDSLEHARSRVYAAVGHYRDLVNKVGVELARFVEVSQGLK
jgi:hypothetical protein